MHSFYEKKGNLQLTNVAENSMQDKLHILYIFVLIYFVVETQIKNSMVVFYWVQRSWPSIWGFL